MSDAANKTATQKWAIEKPKHDNARQLRGMNISSNQTMKSLSSQRMPLGKSWSSDASSNVFQNRDEEQWRNPPQYWETQDKIVVDADESTRPRLEGAAHEHHQDRIIGKGMKSVHHYSLIHKFIPMLQAIKIPDAKAAVVN